MKQPDKENEAVCLLDIFFIFAAYSRVAMEFMRTSSMVFKGVPVKSANTYQPIRSSLPGGNLFGDVAQR